MAATEEVWMPREIYNYDLALHTGMMVWDGKSWNRSVLQMGSSKVMYWPSRSSPSSYQQC